MTQRTRIDPRSPKAVWENQHRKVAVAPQAWRVKADQLMRAFRVLATQARTDAHEMFETDYVAPSISGVAMMLGGLAIENLLKAIRVTQTAPLFDGRGAFALDSHDVLKLAEVALPSLSPEERLLLERLQQFTTWAGRYPVPLFSDAMRPRTLPDGGFSSLTTISVPQDFDAIICLVERLESRIRSTPTET